MTTTQTAQKPRAETDRSIVAKMIRADLKAAFPGVKFSVTSERSTVRVSWSMGPSAPTVDALVGKYEAGTFDGSDDCYKFRKDRPAHATVMYIFTSRDTSSVSEQAARDICTIFGVEFSGVNTRVGGEFVTDLAYRALRHTDLTAGYHGVEVAAGQVHGNGAPDSMRGIQAALVSGPAAANDNGVA